MGFRTKIEEKAMETQQTLAIHAQGQYIKWLMKEEEVDYETAMAIVQGRTDPAEPEYTLGYKLSDPVWMIALFKQPGKNNRLKAARNFSDLLNDEERKIFWSEVFDEKNAKQFKKKFKEEKKSTE